MSSGHRGKGAGRYTRHLSANEKSFRFLAEWLLLPVDKESVSSYFGTPLLFVFAWPIMGKITKEPFVFRKPETGEKTCFAAQKHFFTPNLLHIPQKSSTFAPAVE